VKGVPLARAGRTGGYTPDLHPARRSSCTNNTLASPNRRSPSRRTPRYLYLRPAPPGGAGAFALWRERRRRVRAAHGARWGAGKTTVCRCALQQIPASCDVAYIFNPKLTVGELLSTICVEFGIAYPPGNVSVKVFVDGINAYLLDAHAKGRHTVLIIDEAQNLSSVVLEQMRFADQSGKRTSASCCRSSCSVSPSWH